VTGPAPGPLVVESLVDRVHGILRARIVQGELACGTRLRQAALADELGISRTPLREALRLLAAEGLVELQPQRGATVADLSAHDMEAAWEARLAVEPGTARLAARRRGGDQLAAMRVAVTALRKATNRDPHAPFGANRDFHVALAHASGNAHLAAFVETIWVGRIGFTIYARQHVTRDLSRRYADEHAAIADAVEAGDEDRAERLVRQHIEGAPPPPTGTV
jgi:DNA-binding GntR family transcriptional regulator